MKKAIVILSLLTSCGVDIASKDSDSSSNTNNVASNNTNIDNSVSQQDEEFSCSDVFGLWKPESESTGFLAILLSERFDFVRVQKASDDSIESCVYSGEFDDGRSIYRCSEHGENYTGEITAEKANESCLFQIEEPSEREEF